MKPIIFISSLLMLNTLMADALAVCPTTGQVMANATMSGNTVVTFGAIANKEAATVSGLTLTANGSGSYKSGSDVATAFAEKLIGSGGGRNNSDFGATAISGWGTTNALVSGATITFVSLSPNMIPLVVSGTGSNPPTITIQGAPPTVALKTLLEGSTVCVGVANNWQGQEYHQGPSGGMNNLIDYKHGPSSKNDPTAPVGTWAISGNTVNYSYHDGLNYTNTVYDNGNGTYTFCDTNGNTTTASIKLGQVGC